MKLLKIILMFALLNIGCTHANSQYKEVYAEYINIPVDVAQKTIKLPKELTFAVHELDSEYTESYSFGSEKIFLVKNKNEKYGVVNDKGNILISAKYLYITPLSYDLFAVWNDNNNVGVIDRTQKVVIPFEYDSIRDINLKENLILVNKNGQNFFINLQNKVAVPFTAPSYLDPFSDGLAAFMDCDECENPKVGYIDKTGKVVIKPQFEAIEGGGDGDDWYMNSFHNGLAVVQKTSNINNYGVEHKYGYINKTGKLVINYQFDSASSFGETIGKYDSCKDFKLSNNQAMVSKDDKTYLIDNTGKMVKTVKFDKNDCPIL